MTTKVVREQLAEWGDKFIQCRDWGHNWRLVNWFRTQHLGVEREFICRTCSTVKRQWVSPRTGEVFDNRYSYPKGYLKGKKVTERINKQDLRVEALSRLLEVKHGRKAKA